MGIEAIAVGAFLLASFIVGGLRALRAWDKAATSETISATEYTGPLYTRHGREIG